MQVIRLLYMYLFLLALWIPVRGNAQSYYFRHYQINDGLSNNAVICSMQDSYGFIWFGTKDGLNRFDGRTFKRFSPSLFENNSLEGNLIISLKEDAQRQIWVGTDQGIYRYNPIDETFHVLSKDFKNTEVSIITRDKGNVLWFISNNRIFSYNIANKTIKQITDYDQFVTALFIAKSGNIYCGTAEGKLYQINKENKLILLFDFQNKFGAKDWFSLGKITENRKGELLLGTSKAGVFIYTPNDHSVKSILGMEQAHQPLYIRDILQPNDQEYWFATESGLFVYQIKDHSYVNYRRDRNNPWSISDDAIYSIMQDRDQGVWLTSYFGGIDYFHSQNNIIEKIMPKDQGGGLQGAVVRIIQQDSFGKLWIGTENGGLTQFDPQTNHIKNFDEVHGHLANKNIHGILPFGDQLLLGTFVNGLDVFDIQKQQVVQHIDKDAITQPDLQSNFIFYLYRTRNQEIWAASTAGLYKLDSKTLKFHLVKNMPIAHYTTILEDSQGSLWIGSWRDGLFCYHPVSGNVKHYLHQGNDTTSLPNNRINNIFEDSKQQIWIATEGGLVKKLGTAHGFERRGIDEGMPSNIMLAIQEDKENNLWISTSRGLVRYNPSSGKTRVFDLESGLPTIQFNYNSSFHDHQGQLYFGTINGMVRFKPEELNQINYSPDIPIYITQLNINNKAVNQSTDSSILSKSILFTQKIQLKHDESSFSLDFAALHFQLPHSIRYKYKMKGLDNDWHNIENEHHVDFTKLAPGNYTFIVRADDPNGNSISTFKTLKIEILPPFWFSIPAFVLYGILLCALIAFIFYHFNERIKQRNRQHMLTTKNIREQELYRSKINFFTEVAHEIRTPLSLIKAPLEKLMDKIGNDPITSKLLQTMQKNTDKLVDLSSQLLDFRKVEAEGFKLQFERQNISKIIKEIIGNFILTFQTQRKELRCDITDDIVSDIDRDAFDKICHNLFNNALKYADKKIEVVLKKDKQAGIITLIVKNDGKLIPLEDRELIFKPFNRTKQSRNIPGSGLGLALSRSLALKHQGTLTYQIDEANWNIFTLTLSLNNNIN